MESSGDQQDLPSPVLPYPDFPGGALCCSIAGLTGPSNLIPGCAS